MKTRHMLVLALLIAVVPSVVDTPSAPAQEARTLTLATLAPPGSTWMRVFEAWNRELRRRSNQTLQFRIYGGGVQGDEAEVIRKIRSGRLDAASVTATGLGQVHRPALVFQMPGILRTYAELDRARDGLRSEMDAGFTASGFHMMGWADVGQARVFSTAPVHSPSELRGRHPFVWRDDSVLPAFYRIVQAEPVQLQIPEVLGAIQTGRVDTAITPPVACIALQWCSRLTNMTDQPLSIVVGGTVIGHSQWESLTEDQRTILTETSEQFHTLARRNLRRDEERALTALAASGTTVVPVSEAQRQQWINVGNQVRGQLVGQIADQALVDRVAAFAAR